MTTIAIVVFGILLVALAVILIIIEVNHPGVFLLIPAGVAAAAGLVLIFDSDLFLYNPLAAALLMLGVGVLGGAFSFPLYKKIAPTHVTISTTLDSLKDQQAVVTVPIEPGTMKGKVKIRGEVWSATSDQGIPEGTTVRIVGGQGVTLMVDPLESPN
jgi:membrane-bound ClpP family serine protease